MKQRVEEHASTAVVVKGPQGQGPGCSRPLLWLKAPKVSVQDAYGPAPTLANTQATNDEHASMLNDAADLLLSSSPPRKKRTGSRTGGEKGIVSHEYMSSQYH